MPNETKQSCATPFKTMIGGQALIEGIMMMGPEKKAIVVRRPDGGLETKVEERVLIKDKHPILGVPFIRGIFNFGSSLANGVKALMYSAEFYPEDEEAEPEEPSKFEAWLERTLGSEKAASFFVTLAVVLGVCFSVLLFFILPTFLTGGLLYFFPGFPLWGRNLIEGVLKIAIFMGYLILCSRMKDIHRTFCYHGAEHKTIFCYEKGLPLTVENVRPQSRLHPRCGTSFLLVVIILGLFVGLLIQVDNTLLRIALRILLLPVLVAVAYELNRWAGRHDTNIISRIVTWPGKQLQRLTTNEPDDGMIECAIRAMELVIPDEKGKDAW